MGTGCARGFLAAFDTAWMVRSWAQGRTVQEVLAERYTHHTIVHTEKCVAMCLHIYVF